MLEGQRGLGQGVLVVVDSQLLWSGPGTGLNQGTRPGLQEVYKMQPVLPWSRFPPRANQYEFFIIIIFEDDACSWQGFGQQRELAHLI